MVSARDGNEEKDRARLWYLFFCVINIAGEWVE